MEEVERQLQQAVAILEKGGVVAFPTDTVYGLGAHAFRPEAVARVYELKKRPRSQPLPLLLAHVSQLGQFARAVPDLAWRLAERFLPGGLTLVLWKAATLESLALAGGDKVALRVPAHPVPRALAAGLGAPITGTSANRSGQPSPVTASAVALENGVDLVIDGGRCPGGTESTVVDLTGPVPVVLREGIIPRRELEEAWGATGTLGERNAYRPGL